MAGTLGAAAPTFTPTPYPGGALFFDDFSTDQGWDYTGSFERGSGGGGPDPAQDHSADADDHWAGTAIGAAPSSGDQNLTSPVIDASAWVGPLELRFWRWLDVDRNPYQQAILWVWTGVSWTPLYNSYPSAQQDPGWTEFAYDLSAYKNSQLRVRFELWNYTGALPVGGWNIDDLSLGPPGTPLSPTPSPTVTATRTLSPTQTPNGFDQALDIPGQPFVNLAGGGFAVQASNVTLGPSAMQSLPLPLSGGTHTLSSSISGPVLLSYAWAVDVPNGVGLALYVDGAYKQSIGYNSTQWSWAHEWIPSGAHTVNWQYYRPSYISPAGGDRVYLDAVSLQAGVPSATITVTATPPVTATPTATPMDQAFSDDFSSDQGWTLSGDWMRAITDVPDPTVWADGNGWVLGTEVPGNHDPAKEPALAVSPAWDLSAASSVELRFASFIRQGYFGYSRVEAFNGSAWVTAWQQASSLYQNAWQDVRVDLSPYKNNALRIRFAFSDNSGYAGWTVDAVQVWAGDRAFTATVTPTPSRTLTPTLAGSRTATPTATITVTRTFSVTRTYSAQVTSTPSRTATPSPSDSPTASPVFSPTPTPEGILWDDLEGALPQNPSLSYGCSGGLAYQLSPGEGIGGSRAARLSVDNLCGSFSSVRLDSTRSSPPLDASGCYRLLLHLRTDQALSVSVYVDGGAGSWESSRQSVPAAGGYQALLLDLPAFMPVDGVDPSALNRYGLRFHPEAALSGAVVYLDDLYLLRPPAGSSPTVTRTYSRTRTVTPSFSLTRTRTPTPSFSASPTCSISPSPTRSWTFTRSPTVSPTFSVSPTATLTGTPDSVPAAVNQPGLAFSHSSAWNVFWKAQSAVSHDGISAAEAAPPAPYNGMDMQVSITGPAVLRWWWLGQASWNYNLYAYLDGANIQVYAHNGLWSQGGYDIPFGVHQVQWSFGAWDSVGPRGYVDEVSVVYGSMTPTPSFTASPTVTQTPTLLPTPEILPGQAYAFPNPAHVGGKVTFRFEPSDSAQVNVYDLSGRDQGQENLVVDAPQGLATWLPRRELQPPGVYFTRVTLAGGPRRLRFVLLP